MQNLFSLLHAPPFQPGDQVTVWHFTHSCRPVIEGRATIEKTLGTNIYGVRFENERLIRTRLLHGGAWQQSPQRLLQELHQHWRFAITRENLDRPFDLLDRLEREMAS